MKVGVLAAQGAFIEHVAILNKLGVEALPVRLPRHLIGLDGLIIPGGESSSISKLIAEYNLIDEIKQMAGNGVPVFVGDGSGGGYDRRHGYTRHHGRSAWVGDLDIGPGDVVTAKGVGDAGGERHRLALAKERGPARMAGAVGADPFYVDVGRDRQFNTRIVGGRVVVEVDWP